MVEKKNVKATQRVTGATIVEHDVDDVKSAAQLEAEGAETIKFQVDIKDTPITLEVPIDLLDGPADIALLQEEKKYMSMFRLILGEVQWDKLRAAGMTIRDLMDVLLPAYNEATGTGND